MNPENLNLSSHAPVGLEDRKLWDPDDVVRDSRLATEEKRALLASWASDLHAVPDAPNLRQLDSGAVVTLTSILGALKALDQFNNNKLAMPDRSREVSERHNQIRTKWRRKSPWYRRRGDDDRSPPTPSAAAAQKWSAVCL